MQLEQHGLEGKKSWQDISSGFEEFSINCIQKSVTPISNTRSLLSLREGSELNKTLFNAFLKVISNKKGIFHAPGGTIKMLPRLITTKTGKHALSSLLTVIYNQQYHSEIQLSTPIPTCSLILIALFRFNAIFEMNPLKNTQPYQPGKIGSGKNKKSGFFLLGFKYTLRTCFESRNFS